MTDRPRVTPEPPRRNRSAIPLLALAALAVLVLLVLVSSVAAVVLYLRS